MRYRPEIDGLRALAVVPVILFHAGFGLFGGGFVGVDVFFVISGYLITGILIGEMDKGGFSLTRFYERRARRILPALFVVMLAAIPFGWMWLTPSDFRDFAESVVAVPLFSSNILFWRESGYFAATADLKPLLHTWSLAVEEQYYIFFPLFLIIAWRLGRRGLLLILAIVFGLSLGLAEWHAHHHPEAGFFLLHTRGWELLIGVFAAFYLNATPPPAPTRLREAGGLAGLALILFAVFAFDSHTPFPGLYALVPTVGAALIVLFADRGSIAQRLLSAPPLVGIGLISYGAYLWHQPLLAFARHRSLGEPSAILMLVLCALTFPLAYLTWRFVEVPFRQKQQIGRTTVFFGGAAAATTFIAAGLTGLLFAAHPARLPPAAARLSTPPTGFLDRCKGQDPAGCKLGAEDRTASVLLIGDSHSSVLHRSLDEIFRARGIAAIAINGAWCAPLLDVGTDDPKKNPRCRAFMQEAITRYGADPAVRTVILAGEWANYTTGERWGDTGPSLYYDKESAAIGGGNVAVFERGLKRTLDYFARQGKTIVLVAPVPEYGFAVPSRAFKAWLNKADTASLNLPLSAYRRRNEAVMRTFGQFKTFPNLTIVPTQNLFCGVSTCRPVDDRDSLYTDGNHLSYPGSKPLCAAISEAIPTPPNGTQAQP